MTDRYAVIGNPIAHSKSPLIHGMFAKATGQDIAYFALEVPLGGFALAVDAMRLDGGCGVNITAPFKLDAFAYATSLSQRAQLAGAVNALRFNGNEVEGENFDGVGLVRDISVNAGIGLAGKRILLLGAGGAARGALLPFLAEQPAELFLVNRTVTKADALAAQFADHGRVRAGGYADIGDQRFDVVINATSASLSGDCPPVPASAFAGCQLAYELVYGKGRTPFLAITGAANGMQLRDGCGMLVEQAAEAFAWWRGVRPETAAAMVAIEVPIA